MIEIGPSTRVLGLFAHPDDEIFCAGGLMASVAEAGGRARIVSLTRGEAGEIRDVDLATRETLGAVRERELREAARVLGVSDVCSHDLRDGTLESTAIDDLVAIARTEIDAFRPTIVVSFGPDGGYGHPDHCRVSEVAATAAAQSDSEPTVLQAVFPQTGTTLVSLLVDWLTSLDERYVGTAEFAHGLMLFANGSSMLGYASDHLEVRFHPPGTCIVEQGEPSGELHVILAGEVDILEERSGGNRVHLAVSGPGCFIGEDGIASGQPRNAHVVARTSVTCFVLSPSPRSRAAGRGSTATSEGAVSHAEPDPIPDDVFPVDVSRHARTKALALACHRSQYPLPADSFPPQIIDAIFGTEYFRSV